MAKVKINQPFTLLDTRVGVAERQTVQLEVAKLYTHTPMTIPIEVVNGAEAGRYFWSVPQFMVMN